MDFSVYMIFKSLVEISVCGLNVLAEDVKEFVKNLTPFF